MSAQGPRPGWQPAAAAPIRIVTYNVQHARLAPGQRRRWGFLGVDATRLARHCAGFGADVLGLQEVDHRVARSCWVDQAAVVAGATGAVHTFAAARPLGLWGQYGNALLARQALDDIRVVALPRRASVEPRVAVVATARAGDQALSVAVTHLSIDRSEAMDQLEATLAALDERPLPRVVLGDLNLGPDAVRPAMEAAGLQLVDTTAATYPAVAPRARIDHIAVVGLAVSRVEVLPAAPVSDHRPLLVELGPAPV